MGTRKHNKAEVLKDQKKSVYMAKLYNNPTSPRKTRLMADLIRGMEVEKALFVLKHSSKESSAKLYKLLLSTIANWQAKNEGKRIEDSNLCVESIFVDSGRVLKRLRTAPQGRGYRIRKRSNHVTMTINSKNVK